MDEKTRRLIESQIDECMKEPIRPEVEWALKELSVSSSKDYALGYLVGVIGSLAMSIAAAHSKPEDKFEDASKMIQAIVKRRLPEIIEKIERELGT